MLLDELDCSALLESETAQVKRAIEKGEAFIGYIPSNAFEFVFRNYRRLAELRVLDPQTWGKIDVPALEFRFDRPR
jgi:hypothetical protein